MVSLECGSPVPFYVSRVDSLKHIADRSAQVSDPVGDLMKKGDQLWKRHRFKILSALAIGTLGLAFSSPVFARGSQQGEQTPIGKINSTTQSYGLLPGISDSVKQGAIVTTGMIGADIGMQTKGTGDEVNPAECTDALNNDTSLVKNGFFILSPSRELIWSPFASTIAQISLPEACWGDLNHLSDGFVPPIATVAFIAPEVFDTPQAPSTPQPTPTMWMTIIGDTLYKIDEVPRVDGQGNYDLLVPIGTLTPPPGPGTDPPPTKLPDCPLATSDALHPPMRDPNCDPKQETAPPLEAGPITAVVIIVVVLGVGVILVKSNSGSVSSAGKSSGGGPPDYIPADEPFKPLSPPAQPTQRQIKPPAGQKRGDSSGQEGGGYSGTSSRGQSRHSGRRRLSDAEILEAQHVENVKHVVQRAIREINKHPNMPPEVALRRVTRDGQVDGKTLREIQDLTKKYRK